MNFFFHIFICVFSIQKFYIDIHLATTFTVFSTLTITCISCLISICLVMILLKTLRFLEFFNRFLSISNTRWYIICHFSFTQYCVFLSLNNYYYIGCIWCIAYIRYIIFHILILLYINISFKLFINFSYNTIIVVPQVLY